MLSTSGVLCNFSGMPQDFPGSVRLGMGNGEKGAGGPGGRMGRREKKIQCFHTSTELAVCDKKLLQLRYRPDVWAKQSQLISQAFIDNENFEEGSWKTVVFSGFRGKGTNHMD